MSRSTPIVPPPGGDGGHGREGQANKYHKQHALCDPLVDEG